MKKLRLAVAVLALACAVSANRAFADACTDAMSAPRIETRAEPPEIVFIHDRSKQDLTVLAKSEHGMGLSAGQFVTGVTDAKVKTSVAVQTASVRLPDGSYCGWPVRIVGLVGFEGPVSVYIAREYPRGSCQYNVVLEHEMTHVAIHQNSLADYEMRIREAFDGVMREQTFPVVRSERSMLSDEIYGRLNEAFLRAVADAAQARDMANGRLDSRENYRRTKALCPSW